MYVNELVEWLSRYPPDARVSLGQPILCTICGEKGGAGVVHADNDDSLGFEPKFEPEVAMRLAIARAEAALKRAKETK